MMKPKFNLKWTRGAAPLVLAGVLALAAAASAPQSTLVQIPLWAPARAKLHAGALRLRGARGHVQLLKLQPPGSPTIVFVMLDLSNAVDSATAVRAGLTRMIAHLPAQTWVGLMSVNDGFHVILSPTRDRAALRRAVQAISPSGHPGLLDSIEAVERIADRVQRQGKIKVAVLAVTDSDVRNYRSDYADQRVNSSDNHDLSRRFPGRDLQSKVRRMDRRLLRYRVPMFILQVKHRGDPLNRIYDNALQRFCATLGGRAWFAQSVAEIPSDLGAAFQRVQSFYLATVRTPPPGGEVDFTLSFEGSELPTTSYRRALVTTHLDH